MKPVFWGFTLVLLLSPIGLSAEPDDLQRWLQPQIWERDTEGPVLSLGSPGDFDDTHILAPCVALEEGTYRMWYNGARGGLQERLYEVGLATSDNGKEFTKTSNQAILKFGDGIHSIKTPTLLRTPEGTVLRESGCLRMWFSGSPRGESSLNLLHEATSADGVHWSAPSKAQLEHVYAPTILKEGDTYRLWYTDVSSEPWKFRYAESHNGQEWTVRTEPVMVVDQSWEKGRLFYPAVVKADGLYLMWYGSYWSARAETTAIGFAVSRDGLVWQKHPDNPVLRPEANRPWESHYTTSQSVMRLADGSWRMWYASRKEPPHINKYFAINTARWSGPASKTPAPIPWDERSRQLRRQITEILNLPATKIDPAAKTHKKITGDGYTIESITYAAEPGSRVTALLYLPEKIGYPVPAVILACGHGGSKSCLYAQYAGQLYARLGFACLAVDTIGEEERHVDRKMGTRAHDMGHFQNSSLRREYVTKRLKRMILGKIVWDLQRGIDYLQTRSEIDPDRIGIMGYSLGGASAGCLALIEPRIKAAVICGWGHTPLAVEWGKDCTKMPYEAFVKIMSFGEMNALAAPHCSILFLSGDRDEIIDRREGGKALVRTLREEIASAGQILHEAGIEGTIESRFIGGADHRPLFLTSAGAEWLQKYLMTGDQRRPIPQNTVIFGDWVDRQGQKIEELYDTEARERGTVVIDIGAGYREPVELAALPTDAKPPPEYTFEGWCDFLTASGDVNYLSVVQNYADAMLESGRDIYGKSRCPLFATAMNRSTMKLFDGAELEAIRNIDRADWGIRPLDRMPTGANPMHDENLYQVLYALTAITGKKPYAEEADKTLAWFLENCQSKATGLLAWGEHIGWDFHTETNVGDTHEFYRPWVLWPKSYELSPGACLAFARGLWNHQISDQATGNFSRHARYSQHGTEKDFDFPRHGGFYIAVWANAYQRTKEPVFTQAVETILDHFEMRRNSKTGIIPCESHERSKERTAWPVGNLSLAVDLYDSAEKMPPELAQNMRRCADKTDGIFLSLAHDLRGGGKGFITVVDADTLAAGDPSGIKKGYFSTLWQAAYGEATDAAAADLCLLRYHQTGLDGYKKLILAAADRYLESEPNADAAIHPGALGDVIWLLLGSQEITAEKKYLDRADHFARQGVGFFLTDNSPLPKATTKHNHYEAITRSDTLMMAFLKLWTVKNRPELKLNLIYTDR